MTTKKWILDMLATEKAIAQNNYSNGQQTSEEYEQYLGRITAIERARALVEKGPDEP